MPRASQVSASKQASPRAGKGASKAAAAKGSAAKGSAAKKAVAAKRAAPAKEAAPKKAVPKRAAAKAKAARNPAPAKPLKAAKKAAKGSPADRFLERQTAKLLDERDTYTHQADSLRAEADQLAEEMEPGDIQFDEESGEGATMNVERERDLTLSAQARAAVEEIDRALAKIDAGTYGLCEQCGRPIPRARLEALPYAALCVACKSGGLGGRR